MSTLKIIEKIKIENHRAIVQEWLEYRVEMGNTSKSTIESYANSIKQFILWFEDNYGDISLIDEKLMKKMPLIVDDYRIHCKNNLGNAKRTIMNKVVAISSFYTWCVRRCKIETHPFENKIEPMRLRQVDYVRKSYFLTQTQIIMVRLAMTMNPKKFDLQDRLIWELFLDSACRIGAIHSLTWEQLDLEENCFNDVIEKNGYIVKAIFFNEAKKLLKKIKADREKKGITCPYIFVTKYKNTYRRMNKGTIRQRIKKMGKIIDIDDLYPHTLRKTALNLVALTAGIDIAQGYGHHNDSIITRRHYMKHLQMNDVREAILSSKKRFGL